MIGTYRDAPQGQTQGEFTASTDYEECVPALPRKFVAGFMGFRTIPLPGSYDPVPVK